MRRKLLSIGVAAAVAAALAAAISARPSGAVGAAPVEGMVAYTRSAWTRWITVADLAGAERHEVTPRPTKRTLWDDYNPVWSPNGDRFVFVRTTEEERADGSSRLNGSLYVANRDGTGLRRVLRVGPVVGGGRLDYPSWSPDGKRLAYGNGPLYIVNGDGTHGRRLAASSACNPVWSPDGRSLLYLVDASPCRERGTLVAAAGYARIYRIDSDGTHRRVLASGSFGDAAWSPDGKRIAYTGECGVQHDSDWTCSVFLMKADGSGKRLLARDTFGKWVKWVAGGREVLWPFFPGLNATNPTTRLTRKLPSAWGVADAPGVSADGRKIAFIDWGAALTGPPRVLVATIDGRVLLHARVPPGGTLGSSTPWWNLQASFQLP